MWNTVLFDLDGTITDSAEGITKGVAYALKKGWGIETADLNQLRVYIGPPMRQAFMHYAGFSADEAERAVALYREYYSARGIHELSLYDGTEELLMQLKRENFTIALTSSKPEEYCRQILTERGIAQYFDTVVGSALDGRRVEKPELIEETLRRLNMADRRAEAVMIGDRYFDINGAKSCGIASIGVTYGFGTRTELEDALPDCIVDSPLELRNVLIGQKLAAERNAGILRGTHLVTRDGRKVDVRKKGCALPSDGPVPLRIWRCIYPLLVEFALVNGTVLIVTLWAGMIAALLNGRSSDYVQAINDNSLLLTGISDAVVIPVMYLMYRADERRRKIYAPEGRIPKKIPLDARRIAAIAVLSIGFAMVLNIIITALSFEDTAYSEVEEALTSPGLVEQLVIVGFIGPVAEELTFRGVIYRRLRDYIGCMWAAVLSGILFGVYHGNLTQGIFAAALGILLALIYEHYGNIWASIAAHMANNIFSCILSVIPDRYYGWEAGFVYLCIAGAIVIAPYIFNRGRRINAV